MLQGRDGLLVLGGQSEGQPDGLTLLRLNGVAKAVMVSAQGSQVGLAQDRQCLAAPAA